MKLTCYGHSAFRIEASADKILVDPFLSDGAPGDREQLGNRTGQNSTQGGRQ